MPNNPYAQARAKKGKALFIPFVVLGDPDPKQSSDVVRLLVESGADALELGFPFSDPPADGPVIQEADVRALKAGTTIDDCFAILREIRSFTKIPIGLLVYFNLVLARGVEKFYADCAASGVDSVLIADLPLEHIREAADTAVKHGIAPVMLISELTTDERLKKIAKIAKGYLYVVSYLGVTGFADGVSKDKAQSIITRARAVTDLPLFVGFGMSTPEQAKAAALSGADGVIVGSRIVKEVMHPERMKEICEAMKKSIS